MVVASLKKNKTAAIVLLFYCLYFYTETKRSHRKETDKRDEKKCSKREKTKDQFLSEEERARQPLMTNETMKMKVFNEGNNEHITPEVRLVFVCPMFHRVVSSLTCLDK